MNMPESLNAFFVRSDQTNLDNCDREAIHLSGQVQNICALLVVADGTQRIIGASENIADLFNTNTHHLIGKSLKTLDPKLSVQLMASTTSTHEVLEYTVEKDGVEYDIITHHHDGRRLVEFIPNILPSPRIARAKMRLCSKSCTQILNATDWSEALTIAAEASRSITGYSRVNIYKFLPDWSGEVLAESLDGTLPSYLGLHFPASDIPKQVREYMTLVPYRAIGNTSDEHIDVVMDSDEAQLDLTWSLSRSVSKMHTTYLRSMGSKATFVTSLMHNGKLWGMISAHNNVPGMLPFDSWNLMQEIGTALMLKFVQEERQEISKKISSLRRIESRVTSAIRGDSDIENVIEQLIPILQDFLKADGFAFQYGSNLHVCGKTPPPDFIRDLITWAVTNQDQTDQFQSNSLHLEWDRAAKHRETACGVLVQPIVVHRVCQLIWFRGPITRKVKWAGRPGKVERDGVLGPRQSFDTWIEEHNDQSLPWLEAELESAKEIFTEFLDLLAAQLLLKEENASLRNFAASAVHDIKAPLRGISMALDVMHEENFNKEIVKATHSIAQTSARRLVDLSSGLLDLAAIPGRTTEFASTDLDALLKDACLMLCKQIESADASVVTNVPYHIDANDRLLLRLFLNLIGNALKFRKPSVDLHIDVSVLSESDNDLTIAVSDNGVGIEPKYAQKVFEPLQRLHSHDEIEGSGLGLTICTRIAEAHGGALWLDDSFQGGARFVVRLPRKQKMVS